MKKFMKYCGIIMVMAGAVALTACGGGGDYVAPAPAGPGGVIVKGPVSGALVFADHNDGSALANGTCDVGEISTISDTDGSFTYPSRPGYVYITRSTGGTDTVTNKPALPMAAPPDVTIISPLTTMVALTPAADQAALIAKLETITGGASYASNLSENATPAVLALAKSIESAINAVSGAAQQAATENGGTALSEANINEIATTVAQEIAVELNKPATTTATLSNSASLATTMAVGATAAAITISGKADTNVVFSNTTAITNAVNTAVNTVASAVATQTGGAGGALDIAPASAVQEAAVIQPIAASISAATNNAVNTTSQTVSAVAVVASDTTRPTVTGVYPTDAATGVSAKAAVRISFSKAMNPATVTGATFSLKKQADDSAVAGVITYDSAAKSAVLTPSAPLEDSTLYQATMTTGALDLSAKLGLAADEFLSFKTAAALDMTPPTATIAPAQSASAAIDSKVVVTFSSQVDPATLTTANFYLSTDAGGAARVSGAIKIESVTSGASQVTKATFIPGNPLAYSTSYWMTMTANIKSIEGAEMVYRQTSFATVPPDDTTKPTVTATSPVTGATGVAVTAKVLFTFDKQIDAATLTENFNFTLKNTDTSADIPGSVAFNYVTGVATFTPISSLAAGTGYTATASTGIKDTVGNALATAVTATFTTAAVDTTKPQGILRTSPSAGPAGVPLEAVVVAAFDKAMDENTVTLSSFTLRTAAGANVTGEVSYDETTKSATFMPDSLSYGTTYTATLTTAISDTVGNALAQTVTHTFTTVPTGSTGSSGGTI